MKLTKILAALVLAPLALVPESSFAQILEQTQSSSWEITRNSTITTIDTKGSDTKSGLFDRTVNKYLGSGNLTQVVIRVLQPLPPNSATISAVISVDGTTTFTSGTNRISETTYIDPEKTSISPELSAMGAFVDDYSRMKNGTSFANQTITTGNPTSSTANITQSAITIFDSSDFGLTSSQLNSLFRDGSNITFVDIMAEERFTYERSGSDPITATFGGTNSGTIEILYYIPEPSTMQMLAGLGIIGVLFSNRRLVGLRRRH